MEAKIMHNRVSASLQINQLPTFTVDDERKQFANLVGLGRGGIETRSLNLLRSTFLKKVVEDNKRLIGITSTSPEEGKSFLTINLACSLAKISPGPVFVVDLDLRRPSLGSMLGLEMEHSITDYLTGEVDELSKVGARLANTNLAVFPSSIAPRFSAEILSSERFSEMVSIFANKSDASIVLFDLPPAFADDDAIICLEHLDGYILVVEASRTTSRQVEKAIQLLSPQPCIGTVLNRYQGGLADPYGYEGYQSYYG